MVRPDAGQSVEAEGRQTRRRGAEEVEQIFLNDEEEAALEAAEAKRDAARKGE